jgi:hypothetical protein
MHTVYAKVAASLPEGRKVTHKININEIEINEKDFLHIVDNLIRRMQRER